MNIELMHKAIRCYLQAGLEGEACRCHEALGEYRAAALLHERAERWGRAGECHARVRAWREAARCYLRQEAWERAAEALEAAGEGLQAAWLWAAKLGRPYRGARLAEDWPAAGEGQELGRALVKVWAGLGREEGRREAEGVLYRTGVRLAALAADRESARLVEWSVELADRLGRADLAATAHAAGFELGLAGAGRRWEAWAQRVLGDPRGIPIEAEEPGALYRDLEPFRDRLADGGEGPELMVLPGGVFRMGDIRGGGYSDEQPVHDVTVERFAIGVYAVTFAEYDRFCELTGRAQADDAGWGRGRRPVINVAWFDAAAYCAWLSAQTGQRYRLPTEAQWEYACRAGSEGRWSFGDEEAELAAYAWYKSNSGGKTHPVGEKKANAWGLYDLHGNVYEWTGTVWGDPYEGQESEFISKNDANYDSASRVVRGGSWGSDPRRLRSSFRVDLWRPAFRSLNLGFRLARIF